VSDYDDQLMRFHRRHRSWCILALACGVAVAVAAALSFTALGVVAAGLQQENEWLRRSCGL
jgi:hypothetical protein